MNETILRTNTLQDTLVRLIQTEQVKLREEEGVICLDSLGSMVKERINTNSMFVYAILGDVKNE